MRKLNFFLVLLSFAAVACTDTLEPIKHSESPSARSEKFFEYSGKDPYINQMLTTLNKPESRTAVVDDFVARFGVPNWDRSLLFQDRDGLMGVATAVVRADTLSGLILSCEDSIGGRLTVFVEKCVEVMQDENFSGMANVLSYELDLADKLPNVLIIKRESEPAPTTRTILYQYNEYQCYGGYGYLPEDMIPRNIWEECYYLRTVYIREKIYNYQLVPQRYITVIESPGGGGGTGGGGGIIIKPGPAPEEPEPEPYDEEDHNKIIDAAFKGKLTTSQIDAIKQGSMLADLLQGVPYNYVHAQMIVGESKEEAIAKTRDYFVDCIVSFDLGRNYTNLGRALHPIMDAYAYAHRNWSTFSGYTDYIPHLIFEKIPFLSTIGIGFPIEAISFIYSKTQNRGVIRKADAELIFYTWLAEYNQYLKKQK